MAIDFNAEPYNDDFDETKKYYRILFRPGRAVQARELTQLQTQLSDQIKKFGNSVFVDGTKVTGGEKFFEKDLVSISINTSYNSAITQAVLDTFLNTTITGATSGTQGYVRKVILGTTSHTLIVKITSGSVFQSGGETLNNSAGTGIATTLSSGAYNLSILFSVKKGIFYVNGQFVYTDDQSIVVDSVSNTSSWNLGFVVTESTVDSDSDFTLLDNAAGTYNYAAPGADRYKIDLVLTAKATTATLNDFIELARVANGQYIIKDETTIYSELGKEFARRTFDESGDYTVSNFNLTFRDNIGGDVDKLTAALDPGKAYVKGYEFVTRNQSYLDVDRARTTATATAIEAGTSYGNFVYVTNLNSGATVIASNDPTSASANSYTTLTLHSVARASVAGATTKLGTARVRFIQYFSGTTAGGVATWKYKMFLFDITMDAGKSFTAVRSLVVGNTTAGADLDTLSRLTVDGSTFTDAFLSGADATSLVFRTNNQFIADTSNVGYKYQKTETVTFTLGVGVLTAGTNELFSTQTDATTKATNYHVVKADGTIVDMIAATLVIGGSGTTATITSGSTTFTATVISIRNADAQLHRTKTLSAYQYLVISPSAANTVAGAKASLLKSDGYDLLAVYNTGTTNPTTQLGTATKFNTTTGAVTWDAVVAANTTRSYTFDNGQRDDRYDHASIQLSGTAPASTDYIVAVFRNFTHGGGDADGNGYLSVKSYSTISYQNIPTYTSPSTGEVYNLRDCFDFRPYRANSATTLNYGKVPDPTSQVTSTYTYYLPRIDKIIATAGKTFEVRKGIPALAPLEPANASDGMNLYTITVPPYTANLNDIKVKYIDNRRYTMRDIGNLEKRIENAEYYTQLSLLEKQAQDEKITDASSAEKFKNGILVDPFAGHQIGDLQNPDYRCAIDMQQRNLRSFGETFQTPFTFSSGSGTVRKGDLITLSYSEAAFADQPNATKAININPFNVVSFIGTINLEPSQDIWVDTITLPPLNVVQDISQTVNVFNGVRAQPQWWWGNNWGWNGGWGWGGWGWGWGGGWNGIGWGGWWNWRAPRIRTTTSTVTTVTEESDSLGTNVVDLQFLPFIRARTIIGVATGLKPNQRHYPFMDTTNISQYSRPLTLVRIKTMAGNVFSDAMGVYETLTFSSGPTAQVAKISPSFVISSVTYRNVWIFNQSGSGTIASSNTITGALGGTAVVDTVTSYALNAAIYTDISGMFAFEYQLPGGIFRTGERKVRLIDNVDNNTTSTQSSGDTTYFALGQLKTEQETILTTRTTTNTVTTTQTVGWSDPLAESFLVDSTVYPNGLHLSSINVYFRTKSSNIPVTMELRKMVNGYPEAVSTITFGTTNLFPESINISEDASAATKFTFPSTVYLPAGEYCFVLLANTNEYEVWVAEMGATMLNGQRMTQQPYAGSLFKSQNSTTWTAVQEEDIKFSINRCVFTLPAVGTPATANFSVVDPYSVTGTVTTNSVTNPTILTAVPAAVFNTIGLGMVITGTGIPTGTTITAATWNGGTTGTITMSAAATASATITATFSGIYEFGTINVNASIISPALTTISLGAKALTRGGSMDSVYTTIVNKQDYDYPVIKKVIPASANSSVASLQLQGSLTSTSDAVSPVIDIGRFGATLVKSVINNDSTLEGNIVTPGNFVVGRSYKILFVGNTDFTALSASANTVGIVFTANGVGTAGQTGYAHEFSKSGGAAWSTYITKKVTLADGFDASNLVVTFDGYKPAGTNYKVYYKVLPVEKTTPIDDESWVEMVIETPIENSANLLDYKEHRYFPAGAFSAFGVPTKDPILVNSGSRFNAFAVKIVMLSSNEAIAPKIRDFRAIALFS